MSEQHEHATSLVPKRLEPDESETERRFGLPVVLGISIGVALLLTAISIGLYYASNLSRIDLSKPKYADIRKDVLPGVNETNRSAVDSTSPITKDSIQTVLKELQARREELKRNSSFNSTVLEDSSLGLDPDSAPAAPTE